MKMERKKIIDRLDFAAGNNSCDKEAIEIVIEMLKGSVPYKQYDARSGWTVWQCGHCHNVLGFENGAKFCNQCGWFIDWEKTAKSWIDRKVTEK